MANKTNEKDSTATIQESEVHKLFNKIAVTALVAAYSTKKDTYEPWPCGTPWWRHPIPWPHHISELIAEVKDYSVRFPKVFLQNGDIILDIIHNAGLEASIAANFRNSKISPIAKLRENIPAKISNNIAKAIISYLEAIEKGQNEIIKEAQKLIPDSIELTPNKDFEATNIFRQAIGHGIITSYIPSGYYDDFEPWPCGTPWGGHPFGPHGPNGPWFNNIHEVASAATLYAGNYAVAVQENRFTIQQVVEIAGFNAQPSVNIKNAKANTLEKLQENIPEKFCNNISKAIVKYLTAIDKGQQQVAKAIAKLIPEGIKFTPIKTKLVKKAAANTTAKKAKK